MKLFFRSVFLVFTLFCLFLFTACQPAHKEHPEQMQQDEVLEDVQLDDDQTVPEMVEQKVDEFNDETQARGKKYSQTLGETSEDEFGQEEEF